MTRDELAEKFVFETHGDKFSNNNDEAGNAVMTFKAGYDAAIKRLQEFDRTRGYPTPKEWADLIKNGAKKVT